MSGSSVNAKLKRWPGWVALAFVAVALIAVGVSRDGGPQTPEERIAGLEKRLACPVCQGESVYESRNAASEQIRQLIRQGVEEDQLTDQQIIDRIVLNYSGEELLVPTTSGVEALAWALPATAFVIGVTGLTIAFRRWRESSRRLGTASEDDYALVAAALEREHFDDEP
jgi:cytochrome c-type biogenesis protein CcmH